MAAHRLLFVTARRTYPCLVTGGAERAMARLVRQLHGRRGVECRVIAWLNGLGPAAPSRRDFRALQIRRARTLADRLRYDVGYPVDFVGDFFRGVREAIAELRPTVVCTQLEGSLLSVEIARAHGCGALWTVHDAEPEFHPPHELRAAAKIGTELVTCSPFLRRRLAQNHGLASSVVYPFVDADEYRVAQRGELITFVNPVPRKGLDTFLQIAQRMPDQRFLVVEGWPLDDDSRAEVGRQLAACGNVQFERSHADMREVYRRTRLLLVPSRWEEAFGRVVLEAQASGIPAIVSKRGGLAEIGPGTVVIEPASSVTAWVRAIRAALDEPAAYARLAAAAARNAARPTYGVEVNAERFLAVADRAARTARGRRRSVRARRAPAGRA